MAEGSIMGEQCNLAGSKPFYGVMGHLDFQESQWCFLGDGGAVDLFGGRQASLQRDGAPPVIWGSRGGLVTETRWWR